MTEENLYMMTIIVILIALIYLLLRWRNPCKDSKCNVEWALLALDMQQYSEDEAVATYEYFINTVSGLNSDSSSIKAAGDNISQRLEKYYKTSPAAEYQAKGDSLAQYVQANMLKEEPSIAKEGFQGKCRELATWYARHNISIPFDEIQKMLQGQCDATLDLFTLVHNRLDSVPALNKLRQINREITKYITKKTADKFGF